MNIEAELNHIKDRMARVEVAVNHLVLAATALVAPNNILHTIAIDNKTANECNNSSMDCDDPACQEPHYNPHKVIQPNKKRRIVSMEEASIMAGLHKHLNWEPMLIAARTGFSVTTIIRVLNREMRYENLKPASKAQVDRWVFSSANKSPNSYAG